MSGRVDDEPEFCGECLEEFRYDDCGGYNPPCPCGCGNCRSCHRDNDAQEAEDTWGPSDDEDRATITEEEVATPAPERTEP